MSIKTPSNLIFTMASSLNDIKKKKNNGMQGIEWRNSIFKTTDYIYSRLSLNGHFYKTNTSVKRTLTFPNFL